MKSGQPEIFATVQGEGSSIGVPSVFVRLAECNLRCTWCDTKYTWDWANYDKKTETNELPVDEVVTRVLAEAGPEVRTLVITGGEPLLQQDELAGFAERMKDEHGFRIEIETNGTITPRPDLATHVDQWNVSPKLASSGNGERARHRPATLQWFATQPNAHLKLVISRDEEADLQEVNDLVTALSWPKPRVLLMPEGTDAATIATHSRSLANSSRKYGYRLGTRLHVFLWGSERGR